MDHRWYKNYEAGVPKTIDPSKYSSVVDMMGESFHKYKSNPAFICMGKTLTYETLDELSDQFAGYLRGSLHLKKGDRVALMMPNILQYPVAMFGVLKAGMTCVNVNPLYTARELEHQLNDSGAKAIVIVENFAHVLEKVIHKTKVEHVIVTSLGEMLGLVKGTIVNAVVRYVKKMVPPFKLKDAVGFNSALSQGIKYIALPEKLTHDDIAFLQYTGGTTGVSKGAVLTHKNMVANILQASCWIGPEMEESKETIVTALPLYHIFSLTANCMTFMKIGGCNLLITNPRDIPGFVKELSNQKFTALSAVNTLFNALLQSPEFKALDFSKFKLALGGGMAVQGPVAKHWEETTGKPLVQAYGLTETSPAATINPLTQPFNGTIGLPISSTEVQIIDEDGKVLPDDEPGELCVRGPQVMKGYWNRPEETEKVLSADGWLKTGDIAVMSAEGFCKIVDRKKDMILVSGFNVYPNEIEDIIVAHPDVVEVAAIGEPDEKSGEVVKVCIVKSREDLTEKEIIDFARKELTGYKVPKIVEFRRELPKTNVGKILRRALRE